MEFELKSIVARRCSRLRDNWSRKEELSFFELLDEYLFDGVVKVLAKVEGSYQPLKGYVKHAYEKGEDLLDYFADNEYSALIDRMNDVVSELMDDYLEHGRDVGNLIEVGRLVRKHHFFTFASGVVVNGDDSLIRRLLEEDMDDSYYRYENLARHELHDYIVEMYLKAPHRLGNIVKMISDIDDVEDLYISYLYNEGDPYGSYTRAILPYLDIGRAEQIAVDDYNDETAQILAKVLYPDV